MDKYVVVGGIYTDTTFTKFADGRREFFGPFVTYAEAEVKWKQKSWENVDNCHLRYKINKQK